MHRQSSIRFEVSKRKIFMTITSQLISPVTEDSPCGENLEYDGRFLEMEQATEGSPEHMMGDENLPAEEPDWKKAKELALSLLNETRDLRVAVQLTRALAHTDGFSGVEEGLALIREYLERYWDCLHPQLDPEEDNDPTFRLNTLETLDDPGAFVSAVKEIPLVEAKGIGHFTLHDVEAATNGENEELKPELIAAAFHEADPESLQQTREHIDSAAEHLQAIRKLLAEKVDPELVPPFKKLTGLYEHLQDTFSRFEPAAAQDTGVSGSAAATGGDLAVSPPVKGFRSREEIARTLEQMCEYFERHEPTSPVPLLLQRAKRLMTMNFIELVEELANDGSHQAANSLGMKSEED